jgi:hypothetical protein
MRAPFAILVLALATHKIVAVPVRSAAVVPLTASDHRAIETLYARILHDAAAARGQQWLTNLVVEPMPDGATPWPYRWRFKSRTFTLEAGRPALQTR